MVAASAFALANVNVDPEDLVLLDAVPEVAVDLASEERSEIEGAVVVVMVLCSGTGASVGAGGGVGTATGGGVGLDPPILSEIVGAGGGASVEVGRSKAGGGDWEFTG